MKENSDDLFYQESGKYDLTGFVLSLALYLLIAVFAGYLYTLVVTLIPIVYFNFIIALTVATGLGLCVKIASRLSKNRNRNNKIMQAIFIGVIFTIFQWIAYVVYAYKGHAPSLEEFLSGLELLLHPGDLFYWIGQINHYGMWSMFGMTVSGFTLTLVWLLEFGIFVTIPVILVYRTKAYPYSENQLRWFKKYTLFKDFESLTGSAYILDDLKADPLVALNNLKKGDGLRHTKAHLFYLENEDFAYLTLEKIFIEGQGKGTRHVDIILNNFKLTRHNAEQILKQFENNKEKIDVI
ncbi:MAG: hypothetical protein IPM77_11255 [Crocinitomicaceae bacterium]|nr:hypothetical protein [Crocinitomicaceae bacterium]